MQTYAEMTGLRPGRSCERDVVAQFVDKPLAEYGVLARMVQDVEANEPPVEVAVNHE